jgi:cephalosporin-C deacetylase-like acetyl esterase
MQTRRTFISLLAGLLAICTMAVAQQSGSLIKVNVAPQHSDWVYKPGETVKFDVTVTKNNVPLPNVEITYEAGPEMLPPVKRDKQTLRDGKTVIDAGTMRTAGFLRCRVDVQYDGKNYQGLATAAFSPETIQPTTTLPADFGQFWDNAKSELSKIPLDARLTLLPERCTGNVNVYHVSILNFQNSRLYGILCVPKAPGKYPAILRVPGAGVRPYNGDVANAEKGAITLEIGIHGVPVIMESGVYTDMSRSALNGYQFYNLDNKDRYYYKRVYLGCVRAVDFIFSLPEFDGSNVVVIGGSQGGALAIVTAVLDNRIKGLVSFYPALCDLTGYLNGRAGGWPHMFNDPTHNTPAKVETSKYYDVVNFARQVKVSGFYSWGYNDVTCPPTSMYATYNVIKAPRTLYLAEETGHWTYPEQWEKATQWMFDVLSKR